MGCPPAEAERPKQPPGRPHEADGDVRPRWMVTAAGEPAVQNPAYRPALTPCGPSPVSGRARPVPGQRDQATLRLVDGFTQASSPSGVPGTLRGRKPCSPMR